MSSLFPISAIQPQPIGTEAIFALALVAAIVIGALVAFFFGKRRKGRAVAAAVAVVAVAGVAAIWYTEPNISYYLMSPYTSSTEDNSLTMHCENTGHLTGILTLSFCF